MANSSAARARYSVIGVVGQRASVPHNVLYAGAVRSVNAPRYLVSEL